MSDLRAGASREEIEEEFEFVSALLQSLDDGAEDAAEERRKHEAAQRDLLDRLGKLDSPAAASRARTPETVLNRNPQDINLPSREGRQRFGSTNDLGKDYITRA